MAPAIPKSAKAWVVEGQNGFDSLKLQTEFPVQEPTDYEVLVKFHAASLNYRDLIIPKGRSILPHNYRKYIANKNNSQASILSL